MTRDDHSTTGELRALAIQLKQGLHKSAVLTSHRFPYGLWMCADGREVLFDRSYQPIWEWHPDTGVDAADPDEWVKDIVGRWILFEDGREPWRQYQSMRALRTILRTWGLIRFRGSAFDEWKKERAASSTAGPTPRVRSKRFLRRNGVRKERMRIKAIPARDADGSACVIYELDDGRYALTLAEAEEMLSETGMSD